MQKITAAESLKASILLLESRQIENGKLLKEQFPIVLDSLRPINLLRKVIKELITPSDLKDDVIQTVVALISGYLSRKILVRSSGNPLFRLGGIVVQYSITRFFTKNAATIEALGRYSIKKIFGKSGKFSSVWKSPGMGVPPMERGRQGQAI
jgi:hypothetical protein